MKFFIRLSLVFLPAIAAVAQTNAPVSSPPNPGGMLGAVIMPAGRISGDYAGWTFSSLGPGMPGGAVTGAPYSAEQVTEHVQTLADGTHITQPEQTTKFYRDSQGRTRTERSFPLPPGPLSKGTNTPSFIEISDPVAHARYTLESQSHTAHRVSMPAPPPPPANANGAPVAPVKAVRILPAPIASPYASTQQDQTSRPQVSHESLGTQTIEGVQAEGSRTTITYPIGAIGNDRPVTTTTETWTSAELKVTVLSKNSDPRNGESVTRLTHIFRWEPDPSLFQVPPDYQVTESQPAEQ